MKTFGALPECNAAPQLDNQLVNKLYVDHLSIHQSVSGIIYNLSIYQTKSDMVNYLTVDTANTTYQQKNRYDKLFNNIIGNINIPTKITQDKLC